MSSQEGPARQSFKSYLLLGASFFLSGIACLTYEIVWQRVLVRLVGASTPAVSLIVASFMFGLALGGLTGTALIANLKRKQLLGVLAALELLIGICGLASVFTSNTSTIMQLNHWFGSTLAFNYQGIPYLTLAFVLILVIIPTTLMGATLPVLAGIVSRTECDTSVTLNRFYAVNTTGAVFGALLTGFILLPQKGISETLLTTAGFNILASALAVAAGKLSVSKRIVADSSEDADSFAKTGMDSDGQMQTESVTPEPAADANESHDKDAVRAKAANELFLLPLTSFVAFLSMTMQVVWTRFLVLLFGSSTYAISLVLAVFISGLALGAWMASSMQRRLENTISFLPLVLSGIAALITINLYQYQSAPLIFLGLKKQLLSIMPAGFMSDLSSMLLMAIVLIWLPAVLMGMFFPLVLANRSSQSGRKNYLASATGRLYSANALGAALGSLLAGTIILPVMAQQYQSGIEATTIHVLAGYGLAGAVTLIWHNSHRPRVKKAEGVKPARDTLGWQFLLVMAAVVGLTLCRPPFNSTLMSSGIAYVSNQDLKTVSLVDLIDLLSLRSKSGPAGAHILMYREGLNSTISVEARPLSNIRCLKNNGKTEASIPIDMTLPAPQGDLTTQELLGLIPVIFSPSIRLDGLVIGYGSGTTSNATLSSPEMRRLTTIDIEPAVYQAGQFFGSVNKLSAQIIPSQAGGSSNLVGDARHFLDRVGTQYDFIVSQPGEPWLCGSADLYTVEFYRLAKSRLKNCGIFFQWLPLYSVTDKQLASLLKTYREVFPNTTVWRTPRAGELIISGSQNAFPQSIDTINRRIHDSNVGILLQRISIEDGIDLTSNILVSAKELETRLAKYSPDIPLNTDDNLMIEGRLAQEMPAYVGDDDTTVEAVLGRQDPESISTDLFVEPASNIKDERLLASLGRQYEPLASDWFYLPYLVGATRRDVDATPYKEADNLFKARYYFRTGHLEEAISLFNHVKPDNSTSYSAYCDMAGTQLLSGSQDEALRNFTEARKILPQGARSTAGIGLCQWAKHDWEIASTMLRGALSLDPNQFLARYALGQILIDSGKEIPGLQQMRAAGQVNPASAHPGIFVTAYYVQKGDLVSAEKNFQLFRQRQNNLPEGLALGYLLYKRKGNDPLAEEYRKTFQASTNSDITVTDAIQIAEQILTKPSIIKTQ